MASNLPTPRPRHILKIILIGDGYTGKTGLIYRYKHDKPMNRFPPNTMGTDFTVVSKDVLGQCLKVQIWDIPGRFFHSEISTRYMKGAMGAMIVYDINNCKSFDNLPQWFDILKKCSPDPNIVTMLVGNDYSRKGSRAVSTDRGKQFADYNGMLFIETSEVDDSPVPMNVNIAFDTLITNVYECRIQPPIKADIKEDVKSPGSLISKFFSTLRNDIMPPSQTKQTERETQQTIEKPITIQTTEGATESGQIVSTQSSLAKVPDDEVVTLQEQLGSSNHQEQQQAQDEISLKQSVHDESEDIKIIPSEPTTNTTVNGHVQQLFSQPQ